MGRNTITGTYITLTNLYDHSSVIVNANKIDLARLTDLNHHTEFDYGERHYKVVENRFEILGKIAQAQHPEELMKKKETRKKKVDYPDPRPELDFRIRFAANIYGGGWRRAKEFLEAVREEIRKYDTLTEKYLWRVGYPEEEGRYLVTYFVPQTGIDPDDTEMEIMTADWDGVWHTDLDTPFAIMAWMELPDVWRGVRG